MGVLNEETKELRRDAFCRGFAYGCRYGYEGTMDGEMPKEEIFGTWIMAKMKFDKLERQE